jgi:hypothetical protein
VNELTQMSLEQWSRYTRGDIQRMVDDQGLDTWHPDVDPSLEAPIGIWRCPSGEITCAEGCCDDSCACCPNARLWESPVVPGWQPECIECNRLAFLVEIVEPDPHPTVMFEEVTIKLTRLQRERLIRLLRKGEL